jgi:DNA-binding Lrp family transcriptional regulator
VITAFSLIEARPERISELSTELADIEGVSEVYSVAGEVDIVVVIRVRDHDELAEVVTGPMALLDGILKTRTLLAFRAYGRQDLAAAYGFSDEAG